MFEFDYSVKNLKLIRSKGTHIDFFVTPRFVDHYIEHEYEPFSIEILKNYLPKKGVFVDVGAHYGYYSLVASRFCEASVVAIEAVPTNFRILSKNLAKNKVLVLDAFNAAASDTSGQVDLHLTEASDSAGLYDHPLTKTTEVITQRSINLDESLSKLAGIDFMKIDVEGHECAVLDGLKKTVKHHPNMKLLIEFNPKCQIAAGKDPVEVLVALRSYGFDLHIVDEDNRQLFRLTNLNKWRDYVAENGYVNIFATPTKYCNSIIFYSHTSELGGAELSLLTQLKQHVKNGDICHVVLPNSTGAFIKAIEGTAVTHSVSNTTWWSGIGKSPTKKAFLESLQTTLNHVEYLKKINPHLLYTSTGVIPWGAIAAWKMQLPHVWHVKEFIFDDHQLVMSLNAKGLAQFMEATSELLLSNSKSVMDYFNSNLGKPAFQSLYYSFELPPKLEGRLIRIFKQSKALKVLLIGSVHKGKGHDIAIQAVKSLIEQKYKIELAIVGLSGQKTEYVTTLVKLAKKFPAITFHKHIKNPYQAMYQADVILVPSIKEAFGRVAVESMLAGKPVIGSKSGGLLEIIKDGVTGILFKAGDSHDLEKALVTYIQDPDLLVSHGAKARELATAQFVNNNFISELRKKLFALRSKSTVVQKNSLIGYLLELLIYQLEKSPSETQKVATTFTADLAKVLWVSKPENSNLGIHYNDVKIASADEKSDFIVDEVTKLIDFRSKVETGRIWHLISVYFKLRDSFVRLFR